MRRKRLNHYADVICKMFMGWRMYDDLEILAELPDGQITINLLTAQCIHDSHGEVRLHIAEEIKEWLISQCHKESIPFDQIKKADLEVIMDTSMLKCDKKKVVCFSFDCSSEIDTDEHVYKGHARETHKWHNRIRPNQGMDLTR